LMNDCQTTGGYPRIACIIEADLYRLAQIRLGQPVHFVQCSLDEALQARRADTAPHQPRNETHPCARPPR